MLPMSTLDSGRFTELFTVNIFTLSPLLPPPKEVMFLLRSVSLSIHQITEEVPNGF